MQLLPQCYNAIYKNTNKLTQTQHQILCKSKIEWMCRFSERINGGTTDFNVYKHLESTFGPNSKPQEVISVTHPMSKVNVQKVTS